MKLKFYSLLLLYILLSTGNLTIAGFSPPNYTEDILVESGDKFQYRVTTMNMPPDQNYGGLDLNVGDVFTVEIIRFDETTVTQELTFEISSYTKVSHLYPEVNRAFNVGFVISVDWSRLSGGVNDAPTMTVRYEPGHGTFINYWMVNSPTGNLNNTIVFNYYGIVEYYEMKTTSSDTTSNIHYVFERYGSFDDATLVSRSTDALSESDTKPGILSISYMVIMAVPISAILTRKLFYR